jgi:hypothetical protein
MMSGPNRASNSTESQMIAIASDAHISGTRISDHRRRFGATWSGSCDVVVMSHLLLVASILAPFGPRHISEGADHGCGEPTARWLVRGDADGNPRKH